ncbi:Defective in cullin neddylation protein 1 [Erysiphe necator]|nr:Defective in cullin neddylation protein 1 [Erysiphe necator]
MGVFFANVNSQSKSKERENLENLFQVYHDPQHEKDTLSVDGVMRYLQDLGVNLETAEIFIPLEIVQAPGLGEITRIGFINGWSAFLRADIQTKNLCFWPDTTDVYRHAFFASKESSQKAIPLENAIVYWSLLFNSKGRRWASESVDWLSLWIEYLQKNWNRTVNKDMWNQTFEFYQKSIVDEKLSFWSEDGAWPGVIDGFVSYVKSKKAL